MNSRYTPPVRAGAPDVDAMTALRRGVAAMLLALACGQASALPDCSLGEFSPIADYHAQLDASIIPPLPRIAAPEEDAYFDYVEVDGRHEPGYYPVYEASVLKSEAGTYRVVLVRVTDDHRDDRRGGAVVHDRALPASLALRLHRGVVPILARTHYAPEHVQETRSNTSALCLDGEWIQVLVGDIGGYSELVGGAWAPPRDSEAGAVEALGRALRAFVEHRIGADGLDAPLAAVEAHAKP